MKQLLKTLNKKGFFFNHWKIQKKNSNTEMYTGNALH